MDPYPSWGSRYMEEDDEPYHCSPACSPDDIIWEGSDTEELPEETQAKRVRYEKEAKRYMRGLLPILQSTSLRGPLHLWENPWRYRPPKPRKVEKRDDWRQPVSLNKLFTREIIMKRAADYGLGSLNPAGALAQRKKSAIAETEATNAGIVESIEPDLEIDEAHLVPEYTHDGISTDCYPTKIAKVQLNHGPSNLCERHLVTDNLDTVFLGRPTEYPTRGTKRTIDSQWLKGSYISKRARWGGPTISSPTPLPDKCGDRRRQGFSRPTGLSVAQLQPASRRTISLPPILPQNLDVAYDNSHTHDLLTKKIPDPSMSNLDNWSLFIESSSLAPHEQVEDVDVLQEEPQPSISAISFNYGSSIKPQRTPSNEVGHSLSDIEPDDLTARTPHVRQSNGTLATNAHESDVHPNLRHESETILQAEDSGMMRDISFVTEVAPSCRDLEKFQYRKKRRIIHQKPAGSELDSHENAGEPLLSAPKLVSSQRNSIPKEHSGPTSSNGHKDEWDTTIEELEPRQYSGRGITPVRRSSLSPDTILVEIQSPRRAVRLLEDSTTPPRSEKSDASWEMIDDLVENSSFRLATNSNPERSITPTSASTGEYDLTLVRSAMNEPTQMRGTHHSLSPPTLSQLDQSLCNSKPHIQSNAQQISQRLKGVDLIETNEALNQNDLSTQSASTIPTRSMKTTKKASSTFRDPRNSHGIVNAKNFNDEMSFAAMLQGEEPSYEDNGESSEENIEYDMDCIQKALSQNCPSTSSESSSQTDRSISSQADVNMEGAQEEENHNIESTIVKEATPKLPRDLQLSHNISNEDAPGKECIMATTSFVVEAKIPSQSPEHPSRDGPHLIHLSLDGNETGGLETEGTPTPDAQSEASWQGCATQSPWRSENIEALPKLGSMHPRNELSIGIELDMSTEENSPAGTAKKLEHSRWQHLEHPLTSENDGIKSFKNFMTPIKSPEPSPIGIEASGMLSTQLLVEAATNNPWTSSLRQRTSAKSKKRVSFGILPSEQGKDSGPEDLVESVPSRGVPGSPPPPGASNRLRGEVRFNGDNTAVSKFESHFTAARTFKRILPDKSASQMNSSPAIDAMAEAFIAADREVPSEQELQRAANRSPDRHFKVPPEMVGSTPRQDNTTEDTSFIDSFCGGGEIRGLDALTTNFDMDDVLGEVGDFLEDWSVEAELKKAKESDARESANNGLKRRKSFGIA